jgi:regulator of cell morphogenesis and NO signaling
MIVIRKRKIGELVSENYLYASILYFFGIEFYNYPDNTLEQICKEKGLDVVLVIDKLQDSVKNQDSSKVPLMDFPIDLLIEYLKHAHHTFVKQKLPYLARCVDNLVLNQRNNHLVKDLKFIFPLFLEDFIKHIYEEEDILFSYILSLYRVLNNKMNINSIFFQMEKYTIHDFAIEHSSEEDEMSGMRKITNNYDLSATDDVLMKIVLSELKAFDEEMKIHAKIEDEILFPKALLLEKEVKEKVRKNISAN